MIATINEPAKIVWSENWLLLGRQALSISQASWMCARKSTAFANSETAIRDADHHGDQTGREETPADHRFFAAMRCPRTQNPPD